MAPPPPAHRTMMMTFRAVTLVACVVPATACAVPGRTSKPGGLELDAQDVLAGVVVAAADAEGAAADDAEAAGDAAGVHVEVADDLVAAVVGVVLPVAVLPPPFVV